MRIEWLMKNVTADGTPVRAESGCFWVIFDVFLLILTSFVVGKQLFDLETTS